MDGRAVEPTSSGSSSQCEQETDQLRVTSLITLTVFHGRQRISVCMEAFFFATTDPASFVATICYSVHAACQNMPDGIMTDHHYSDDI